MERGDPEQIAKVLLQLGVQEQNVLQSFLPRMQFGSAHLKLTHAIQEAGKRGEKENVRALIAGLRAELNRFDAISRYVFQEQELHNQELAELSFEESILQKEVAEAQQSVMEGTLGPAAKRRVAEYALKTQQSLRAVLQERSFEDYIGSAIAALKNHILTQSGYLDRERALLNKIEQGDVTDIDKLSAYASAVQLDVMTEKQTVIEPLNAVVKKKIDVASLLKETVAKRDKISLSDVQGDLRSFTKSYEVSQYVAKLMKHAALVDPQALAVISRYGERSAYNTKSELERKEAEIERLAKQKKELELKTQTDALTGVSNRGAFDIELRDRIRVAERESKSVSFIILDLDKFKQVNDKGGHAFGDLVLKKFAYVIRTHIKGKDDFFARIGGEEFGLLVFTDAPAAYAIAERLRKLVGREMMAIVGSNPAIPADTLTVSSGVGIYQGTGHTLTDTEVNVIYSALYSAADQALYISKQKRNRVTLGQVLQLKTVLAKKAA